MQQWGFWKLGDTSNDELLGGLKALLVAGARTDARVVAHLAEIDARRLTLLGGMSLFEYCTKRLGLSEHEAYFRICAARSARKFPIIFELLERRELHLSAVALLSKYLTQDNHFELLAEARGQSKRKLLKLLASRWPKADFTSQVRRLPLEMIAAGPTGSLEYLSEHTHRLEVLLSTEQHEKLELARDLLLHANPTGNLSVVLERALDLLIAHERKRQFGVPGNADTPAQSTGGLGYGKSAQPKPSNVPEGGKAEEAPRPGPNAEATQDTTIGNERSVDGVKGHAEGTETVRTGARTKYSMPASSNSVRTESLTGPGLRAGRRASVPREIRRQVLERDGYRCTFTSPQGERCECRRFLQIHHDLAWAKGGPETLQNLRLLCAAHNRLLGEIEFGEVQQTGSTP